MLKSVTLNKTTIKVAIADSEKTRKKGLSGISKLGKNKGMLFIFPEPKKVWMVMTDMNFDLDFIFLDKDFKVLQLNTLSKNNKDGVESFKAVQMVLEANKGTIKESGVKLGDKLKPEEALETHSVGVAQYKHGGTFQKVGDIVYEVKEDDIKIEKDKLQVLNSKGEVTANIEANARIFSREHTKEIVKKVKTADDQEVGKLVVKIFDTHDSQKQDYVKK